MRYLILAINFLVAENNWYHDAIWYQIFPDRFFNGDLSNDPTIETLEGTWPYDIKEDWQITPWTSDWYKFQSWEAINGKDFYYNAQLRRYGGDIQGILDKLDYLKSLGVNSIYLNPIFESPSAHKYGATFYHHIDNNFGPNPKKDVQTWESEVFDDPKTWKWTSADKLFIKLIEEIHKREMKVIIDGVFNHSGIPFFALQDIKINGQKSKYIDWFNILSFDNPETVDDEFDYEGWSGIKDLPVYKEINGFYHPELMNYFKNIVLRWMDPNGDGNPEDGIDGWRLDVAEEVDLKFWKEFRVWVDEINPNAYLTGEVWWENFWDNKMLNAKPWLGDHAFHGVMNYRLADILFKYFIDEANKTSSEEFSSSLNQIIEDYGYENIHNIQNILGSHDTERIASSVVNPDRWIDHANHLKYNPEFNIGYPEKTDLELLKKLIVFQFIFPGSPYIYYGDEVVMVGADDPDSRKPMLWSEYNYEDEKSHPLGWNRESISMQPNNEIFNFYKNIIKLRKEFYCLRSGEFKVEFFDDTDDLIVISRFKNREKVLAIFSSNKKILKKNYEDNEKLNLIIKNCNNEINYLVGSQFSVWNCNGK
ncbi:MAG: alpha-amylase [Candidatus Marinimicrobia bacterium]|nr:alpha-amylase [Candidatus Neomarinimicrobiota bacterium]